MHDRNEVLSVGVGDPCQACLDARVGGQVDADALRLCRRVRIAATVEAHHGEALSEGAHDPGTDQTAATGHDDDVLAHAAQHYPDGSASYPGSGATRRTAPTLRPVTADDAAPLRGAYSAVGWGWIG